MASVNVYKGKRGTTYQLTIYKGYITDKNGKLKQNKETITYRLEQMGISSISERGYPRSDHAILRDVQLYADNLEKKLIGANYTKGDKLKFSDFYENTWKPWAENHFSASTFYSYTTHIESIFLPEIGALKIGKITPERLSSLYQKMAKGGRIDGQNKGYSKSSIATFHKQLRSVLTLAKKFKLIVENPCEDVEFPKIEEIEKLKFFTQEQTEIFLSLIESPSLFHILFRIALFSGSRVDELCALTWNDVDFDTCTLKIHKAVSYAKKMGGPYIKEPKTRTSYREVVIPPNEINLLKKLKQKQIKSIKRNQNTWQGKKKKSEWNENYIFCQTNGSLMWRGAPNRALKNIITEYNKHAPENKKLPLITIHGLRHTSATLLIAANMDVKTISSRLGHKNIQTTLNIYAHPLRKRDEEASEILENMFKKEQE